MAAWEMYYKLDKYNAVMENSFPSRENSTFSYADTRNVQNDISECPEAWALPFRLLS